MTSKPTASFEISYKQILTETGELVDNLPKFASNKDDLIAMYKMMVLTRTFDTKAIALQRTGKLGTYPSTLGQEAISVAIGSSMQDKDVLCPYYRELGAQFWRGVKMEEILAFWGGSEDGSNFSAGAFEDFPICVPISSQNLHAVGVASAFKYRKEPRVAVAVVGEGGTSRGDFYEAMNVAGVWKLPVVFVINNNKWAISVPSTNQTAAQTFAQKAIAAGIESTQVDGNDILATREAIDNAIDKARTTSTPMVIEAISYRMCDHTTADDARRYRTDTELAENKLKDPIERLKKYLINEKILTDSDCENIFKDSQTKVATAVDNYLNLPKRSNAEMFNYLYKELPESFEWQREEVAEQDEVTSIKGEAQNG